MRTKDRQTILRARSQARPRINEWRVVQCRRNLHRDCHNLSDAVYGHVFVKADKLLSRAGQHASVASRRQVAEWTVKHMLRDWRLRFVTEHLPTHRLDLDF